MFHKLMKIPKIPKLPLNNNSLKLSENIEKWRNNTRQQRMDMVSWVIKIMSSATSKPKN